MRIKHLAVVFSVFCVLCFNFQAQANAAQTGTKTIYVQTVLTNVDDYPDIRFVQLETLGGRIVHKSLIPADGKFARQNPQAQLRLLAIPQSRLDPHHALNDEALLLSPRTLQTHQFIQSGLMPVRASSQLAGKEVFYRVALHPQGITLTQTGEKTFQEKPNAWPVNLVLLAFIATCATEWFIGFGVLRLVFRRKSPGLIQFTLCVVVVQIMTLPLLWFMIDHYNLIRSTGMLRTVGLAIMADAIFYRYLARLDWHQAAVLSLLCNAGSYALLLMA